MIDREDPKAIITDKEPTRTPIPWVDNAFKAAAERGRPVKRAWNISGKIKISEGPNFES